MIDQKDAEARRPDEREYGPPTKEPRFIALVDLFSVFRLVRDKISNAKKEKKRDDNQ